MNNFALNKKKELKKDTVKLYTISLKYKGDIIIEFYIHFEAVTLYL